ncbi:MAG TPA: hypothetical protein VKE70_36390 [Candidatus Solibacter sp.]|nr:hypothetical protein [Candidatus Solibacter sp.]
MAELWQAANKAEAADTFNGPWGAELPPDPKAVFTFIRSKTHGNSPGLTVRDPEGTEWSVKQGPEGPVEVTVSRVLSAVGYHQPPVYYLKSMAVDHGSWVERASGGRFRPHIKSFKQVGEWSWQQNPFVGTRPYQGLLVILMVFNASDLKNSNNSLYELKQGREGARRWFVVRDLGAALGDTGRLDPRRGDPDIFERLSFVTGVSNGFVKFNNHGFHQELLRDRITTEDVRWACNLLARLNDGQWEGAFRAGGFQADVAQRFIRRIKEKVHEGQQLI